jgi:hypothetical protein
MKQVQDSIEAKRKKYEEQGFADLSFEKSIGDKKLKMWLPSSIFMQQTMLLMASKVVSDGIDDIDEASKLNERYIKAVAKHTQINGEDLKPETCGLADCQGYILLYWTELLAPLSRWGETRAKKIITS